MHFGALLSCRRTSLLSELHDRQQWLYERTHISEQAYICARERRCSVDDFVHGLSKEGGFRLGVQMALFGIFPFSGQQYPAQTYASMHQGSCCFAVLVLLSHIEMVKVTGRVVAPPRRRPEAPSLGWRSLRPRKLCARALRRRRTPPCARWCARVCKLKRQHTNQTRAYPQK